MEQRRWDSGVGSGAPGKGWRGSGREASGRALEVPESARAGMGAPRAGTRERAPWMASAGAERPPGALPRPAGLLRASPGTHLGVGSTHVLRESLPGARGGSGTRWERRVSFCFSQATERRLFLPTYLGFCNLFGENFRASGNKASLKNRSVVNARFISICVPIGAHLRPCLRCV